MDKITKYVLLASTILLSLAVWIMAELIIKMMEMLEMVGLLAK